MNEVQLTQGPYGHTLNATQVFSPDGQWVVYDTRNDDAHIARTSKIEKVNLETGEIVTVYTTKNQTLSGPGVGAAAFHPSKEKLIFIHGLENCTETNPYGFTRRFGAMVENSTPGKFKHAEARKIHPPFVEGALRGGTHAHSWNGNGTCISFTYNDYIMEQLEKTSGGKFKDLRTIGMMVPDKSVQVENENEEDFSGAYYSFVTATVHDEPQPGTDEIDRAFDECWIGTNGYLKENGSRQNKAIAFQGNVRSPNNETITEVFVSDVPDEIKATDGAPLEGSGNSRPHVPMGMLQRRLTFTSDNTFAGIQGPRCRLRSSPDGSQIYFHMKDTTGIVQIYSIGTVGGTPRKVTSLAASIEVQYNVSPDGDKLSCISDGRIWIVDLRTGNATPVSNKSSEPLTGGALWSPDGTRLVYNRFVGTEDKRFLQIFVLTLDH